MKIPVETKPTLWGIAGGAVGLAIIGFTWGGWTTAAKAEAAAQTRANDAVVAALAPMCVDRFKLSGDATANLVTLRKTDSWTQGEFVEKGGWATLPGKHTSDEVSAVAKACAVLLAGA